VTRTGCLILGAVIGALLTSLTTGVTAWGQDPAKVAPRMYPVIFESDHYRVIDYRLQPGGKEPMHSHPNGVLVYQFSDANTRITLQGGKTSESSSKAGDVVWRDPVTHRGENIGTTEAHSLLIEPKSPCK
jgi:beta-alanine degradation protein BauB